jgi:type III restriction enzyme
LGGEQEPHPASPLHGEEVLNLILEVSGRERRDKEIKVATAKTLWVPAINQHGGFGKWAFFEIRDPWDFKNEIREIINQL